MSNDKLKSLLKYQSKLKEQLSSPPPEKQKTREAEYRFFLEKDLEATSKKITALIDSGAGKRV